MSIEPIQHQETKLGTSVPSKEVEKNGEGSLVWAFDEPKARTPDPPWVEAEGSDPDGQKGVLGDGSNGCGT